MFRGKFSALKAFIKLLLVIYCGSAGQAQIGQTIKDSISEFDLLSSVAIQSAENINSGGVTYVEGTDGFPAFSISNAANLQIPFQIIGPDKIDEFALMATIKTSKPNPSGYLFAVVNSLETIIQLGVKISAAQHNHLNLTLIYNDPKTKVVSENLVSFTLPFEARQWINIAFQVMNDKVILYHNCLKIHEVNVTKEPKELIFESSSTFYLAQSGNSRNKFEVIKNNTQN